jgi:DHA1 family multidrug resistance protein-like MFS transporter
MRPSRGSAVRKLAFRAPFNPAAWALFANSALLGLGFYMLYPLLAVHFTADLALPAATVGLVLAVRQFLQQGFGPLGGALSDRIGYKPAILVGLVVRAGGFLLFGLSTALPGLVLGAMLSALGGSLFESPGRGALVAVTPPRERARVFAAFGVANWIGLAVGPLLGSLLLGVSFQVVSLGAASVYAGCFAVILFLVPSGLKAEAQAVSLLAGLGEAMRDRPFVIYSALLAGYWFLTVQYFVTVPLLVGQVAGVGWLGPIYAARSVLALLIQYPLARWLGRRWSPFAVLAVGTVIAAAGFAGLALASTPAELLIWTLVETVGEVVVSPAAQVTTARLGAARPGTYFGLNSLGVALGGSAGNLAGGVLVDLGGQLELHWLPWATFGLVGLATGLGLWWLRGSAALRQRLL